MKKVLITGANSYIGTNVENWLKRNPEQFEVDVVDTINEQWKMADFSKYDCVYHVAGIAHVNAKKSMESLYYKVNRDLTIEIAKHAKKSGIKQFIFMSSMIVYHESRSLKKEILDENSLPNPNGFYGNSKLEAEKGLLELNDENFKVVIVRPPMVYGPGCKGNFPRLIKLACKTPIFPRFNNQRSMIYIDNLCEFIKQAIINEINGIYHPQNSEYANTLEIVKFFANENKHKIYIWKWLNIFVYMGSPFINSLNKMFATYCYDQKISKFDFPYNVISLEDSFKVMNEEI